MSLFHHRKFPLSLEGFADAHSHILPGVDDGVQSEEESLRILKYYEEAGVREVWLTPHIMEDYANTPEDLRTRFELLQEHYRAQGGTLPLYLAAEYMIDRPFADIFAAGNLLTHGAGHLLVETSYFEPPIGFEQTLFGIMTAGYLPILAHPERYVYMDRDFYLRLKKRGILFQMNLGSLAGMYGRTALKKAEWMAKEGLYDLCGSDIHRYSMLDIYQHAQTDPRWKLPLGAGSPQH